MTVHMHIITWWYVYMNVKQNLFIQSRLDRGAAYLSVGVSRLKRAELQEPVRGGRGGLSSSPSMKPTHKQFEKAILIFNTQCFISALVTALSH